MFMFIVFIVFYADWILYIYSRYYNWRTCAANFGHYSMCYFIVLMYVLIKVNNIVEEESIVLCNILYKCILQSYYAIATVTFEVLSDHMV